MKKKILVPTDFSVNARNALNYAMNLYKGVECRFYLLNSYKLPFHNRSELTNSDPSSHSFENEKDQSIKGLKRLEKEAKSLMISDLHSFETISMLDDTLSAMKKVIAEKDISIVVMGTKGSSNYRHKAFGSNTINAMEHIRNCPLLGIPMDVEYNGISEIAFPTNFKMDYKASELKHLNDIIAKSSSNLKIVYVSAAQEFSDYQKERKRLLSEILEDVNVDFETINDGNVTNGLVKFLNNNKIDMVSIINRKHNVFSKLFSSNLTSRLGMFSKIPLLILHDHAD